MRTLGAITFQPVRLLALLPAVIATCWVVVAYKDLDYEVNTTKHYNKRDALYGGYGLAMYECANGYKLQHWEAEANAANMALMTNPGEVRAYRNSYDGGGRILCGSFLPSLVWRLSLGCGDITFIYRATGILLYLLITAATFFLARLYFGSHYAGCAAAFISALYPLHRVCFNQIKVQDGFILLLLIGLLLIELFLRSDCRASIKLVVLTCAIFLGGFAAPANYMLATALAVRFVFAVFTKSQRGSRGRLLIPIVAFVAAMLLISVFREAHGFSTKFWGVSDQAAAMQESFQTFLRTHDWRDIKLMKYSVEQFADFLRTVGGGIWRTNPALIVLFMILPFISRQHLWLWASAFPLLALGHAMMLISGWIYHYGYMTGAGMMIAIILVGGAIGAAMETGWASRKRARAVVAAAALVVVSFSFGRPNDLYLGNCGWYDTDKDIYAIHGPCVKRIF